MGLPNCVTYFADALLSVDVVITEQVCQFRSLQACSISIKWCIRSHLFASLCSWKWPSPLDSKQLFMWRMSAEKWSVLIQTFYFSLLSAKGTIMGEGQTG